MTEEESFHKKKSIYNIYYTERINLYLYSAVWPSHFTEHLPVLHSAVVVACAIYLDV